jgi:hypothetical protein
MPFLRSTVWKITVIFGLIWYPDNCHLRAHMISWLLSKVQDRTSSFRKPPKFPPTWILICLLSHGCRTGMTIGLLKNSIFTVFSAILIIDTVASFQICMCPLFVTILQSNEMELMPILCVLSPRKLNCLQSPWKLQSPFLVLVLYL